MIQLTHDDILEAIQSHLRAQGTEIDPASLRLCVGERGLVATATRISRGEEDQSPEGPVNESSYLSIKDMIELKRKLCALTTCSARVGYATQGQKDAFTGEPLPEGCHVLIISTYGTTRALFHQWTPQLQEVLGGVEEDVCESRLLSPEGVETLVRRIRGSNPVSSVARTQQPTKDVFLNESIPTGTQVCWIEGVGVTRAGFNYWPKALRVKICRDALDCVFKATDL